MLEAFLGLALGIAAGASGLWLVLRRARAGETAAWQAREAEWTDRLRGLEHARDMLARDLD